MFPASTKGGGNTLAFPDVCKVPAPPAPFVPTPFPNTGQCSDAKGSSCSQKVKISNKAVLTMDSEIASTHGDEAGTLKGMVSQTTGDKAAYRMGSTAVKIEGSAVITVLKPCAANGVSANAPPGAQIAPSQTKVIIGR
jgi:hypothetical protein